MLRAAARASGSTPQRAHAEMSLVHALSTLSFAARHPRAPRASSTGARPTRSGAEGCSPVPAAAARLVAGTAATARRGARLAVAAAASDEPEDWEALFANLKPQAPKLPHYKVAILEEALARGRRQVPIRELSADLDMPREDVLAWLKANKDRQPELAAKYPPKPERVATVKLNVRPDGRDYDNVRNRKSRRDDDDFEDDDAYDPQTSYLRNARQQAHVPKGMPAYKGFTKKRLGANNVATLEKVYAHDRYPDDSMVDSVHRATKLPRSKIIAWFKTKREEEKAAKRRAVRGRFGHARGDARGDGDGFYDRRGGRGRAGDGARSDGLREGRDVYGEQNFGRRDSTSGWTRGGE